MADQVSIPQGQDKVVLTPAEFARLYLRIRASEGRPIPSDDSEIAADITSMLGRPLPFYPRGLAIEAIRALNG